MITRCLGWFVHEPLVHFLALGGLIFALNSVLHPVQGNDPHRIVIGKPEIERISGLYAQQWAGASAAADMPNLIENYVRSEVLAREAASLGLAADDAVVRNRLIQKMEFLLQGTSAISQPSDAEMEAYLAAHADTYRVPEKIVFRQVFFSPSVRGDHADGDARGILASLSNSKSDPSGDPFMLANDPVPRSREEIEKDFGTRFASAVLALPLGTWQGPIHSALGVHLVKVEQRMPARLPPLAEVRNRVHDDMMADRFQAASDAAYARVRAHYTVTTLP